MKKINNILLCGLGGVGSIYAQKIIDNTNCDLKILVDKSRFERYSKTPRRINGKDYTFDYILPSETDYDADLIIIASKSSGLDDIIKNINNFVKDDTIILSFINGITSEERIAKVYLESFIDDRKKSGMSVRHPLFYKKMPYIEICGIF